MSAATESVTGGARLVGTVRVPGDKSISHRALLLAALAEGRSTIEGLNNGDDVARTGSAVAALGASVDSQDGVVRVEGGRGRLRPPEMPLDLGNSGTGMRLLAGVAATLAGKTVLTGDDSLRSRPMDRVAEPLGLMGAEVSGSGSRVLPPLTVVGGDLHGIDYTPPMASAQVKSAVLLAGLAAVGETVVREPVATRPHTEDMLAAMGATITSRRVGSGRVIRLHASRLEPGFFAVPGDPSQAAFWLVGSILVPGSLVTVEGISLVPERLGFIGALRRMGATLEIHEQGSGTGSITGYSCLIHGTVVEASEIPSLDEVPILAVAAAAALGESRFCDVAELRVKESDRLAGTVDLVRSFGGQAEVDGDDLVVEGRAGPLLPASFDSRGDHRMAMAAAIAGAACPSTADVTTIAGWDGVATSYPSFAADLARLQSGGEASW